MRFRPIKDKVLIKLDDFERVTDGGMIVPEAYERKPLEGTVIAVGPGRISKKDIRIKPDLTIGDRVFIPWSTGHDLTINGHLHISVNESQLQLVIG